MSLRPLLIAQCVTIIPVLPYASRPRSPPPKLNGGRGGEKQIFSPRWPPSASLSPLNPSLQVRRRLRSSTVRSQIDRIYIYRET